MSMYHLRWTSILCALSALLACESGNVPQSMPSPSASVAQPADPTASQVPPLVSARPDATVMENERSRGLYGASASTIENALQKIGWKPLGSRVGSVKGVQCTTVLASRNGTNAEVKSFVGYPYGLEDMLELKGTAQGLGEMAMITVIVKGDRAKTDELYEQLMGRAPIRHGLGLGFQAEPQQSHIDH